MAQATAAPSPTYSAGSLGSPYKRRRQNSSLSSPGSVYKSAMYNINLHDVQLATPDSQRTDYVSSADLYTTPRTMSEEPESMSMPTHSRMTTTATQASRPTTGGSTSTTSPSSSSQENAGEDDALMREEAVDSFPLGPLPLPLPSSLPRMPVRNRSRTLDDSSS